MWLSFPKIWNYSFLQQPNCKPTFDGCIYQLGLFLLRNMITLTVTIRDNAWYVNQEGAFFEFFISSFMYAPTTCVVVSFLPYSIFNLDWLTNWLLLFSLRRFAEKTTNSRQVNIFFYISCKISDEQFYYCFLQQP